MQQSGGREAGPGGCPTSVLPDPSRETSPDPGPLLPREDSMAPRVPAPFLTRVGHPATWGPCSRYGEEREEEPGQQVKFQNTL